MSPIVFYQQLYVVFDCDHLLTVLIVVNISEPFLFIALISVLLEICLVKMFTKFFLL
jgi:hypothetical protein